VPKRADHGPGAASHIVADQSEVAAFLARPETHGAEQVERIDTHAAMVFLAGERVYKVKRAVDYPYMDFSTLEKRRQACVREVALNRRTARALYLGVSAVRRHGDGSLALDGEGEIVEWAVVMRRFDQDGLFDRLAQAGRLTPGLLTRLADEIAEFHDGAEPAGSRGETLDWVFRENAEEFGEYRRLFPAARARRLNEATEAAFRRVKTMLDDRRARGLVRRCHGDLHLRNICLFQGRPTLFDAIEFSDRIACVDIVYDLAFLLMDLDHRGLRTEANLVLNRYLQAMGGFEVLAALPLFLSLRAAVRAKVSASAAASQSEEAEVRRLSAEAKDYFAAAQVYLDAPPARLVAVGGLSGSGKTRLARSLAPELGPAPGALHLRSDVLRKAMFGVDELTPLPQEAYQAEVSEEVYSTLKTRARSVLAAGHAVVLDAVFAKPQGRLAIEVVAREAGMPFTGLWLDAPEAVLSGRTAGRRGDASDATPEIVKKQLAEETGTITWHRLDASGSPESVAAAARKILGL